MFLTGFLICFLSSLVYLINLILLLYNSICSGVFHSISFPPSFLDFLPSLTSFLPWLPSFLPWLPSFLPWLPSFLPSLTSFLPSFLDFLTWLPSFLDFLPSFPPFFLDFLPSLLGFLPWLPSFLPFPILEMYFLMSVQCPSWFPVTTPHQYVLIIHLICIIRKEIITSSLYFFLLTSHSQFLRVDRIRLLQWDKQRGSNSRKLSFLSLLHHPILILLFISFLHCLVPRFRGNIEFLSVPRSSDGGSTFSHTHTHTHTSYLPISSFSVTLLFYPSNSLSMFLSIYLSFSLFLNSSILQKWRDLTQGSEVISHCLQSLDLTPHHYHYHHILPCSALPHPHSYPHTFTFN